MKIVLAQIGSERGDIDRNIAHHLAVLRTLAPGAADLVVFPELSLSNYDPEVAEGVALDLDDPRLRAFQQHADAARTTIAVGAPQRTAGKPAIALFVFAPQRAPLVIGKRHLHPDELPFFSPADRDVGVIDLASRIGIAICYEISVPEHRDALRNAGATIYLASVAKTPAGMTQARATLAATARRLGSPALLVNSVGTCEGKAAGGGSLAIDRDGRLIGELTEHEEALLLFDADTGRYIARRLGRDEGRGAPNHERE